MASLNGFDANKVEPQGDFEPIPAGKYAGVIIESEFKPTKAGTGKYLEFKIQISEGRYKNRVLFDRLNLDNPNKQAVDIAKATLSSICRAVGVMTPKDSKELHLKRLLVRVAVKNDNEGNPRNEVKGYSAYEVEAVAAGPAADLDETPF